MSTFVVTKGGLTMPQALAAAARNPGADTIVSHVARMPGGWTVSDTGGLTIDLGDTKVDATGKHFGIRVIAPWTTIEGGEVFGADGNGIVVQRTHHVTIDGTDSHDNDGRGVYVQRSDYVTLKGMEVYGNRVGGVSIHYAEPKVGPWPAKWAPIQLIGLDVHGNGWGGPASERQGILLDGKAQGTNDWTSYAGRILVQDCASYDNAGTGFLDYGYKRVVVDGSEFHGNGTARSGTYATQFEARFADEFVFRHSTAVGEHDGYTGVIRGPDKAHVTWDDNDFHWLGHPGEHGVIAVGTPQEMPAPDEHVQAAALHWDL